MKVLVHLFIIMPPTLKLERVCILLSGCPFVHPVIRHAFDACHILCMLGF